MLLSLIASSVKVMSASFLAVVRPAWMVPRRLERRMRVGSSSVSIRFRVKVWVSSGLVVAVTMIWWRRSLARSKSRVTPGFSQSSVLFWTWNRWWSGTLMALGGWLVASASGSSKVASASLRASVARSSMVLSSVELRVRRVGGSFWSVTVRVNWLVTAGSATGLAVTVIWWLVADSKFRGAPAWSQSWVPSRISKIGLSGTVAVLVSWPRASSSNWMSASFLAWTGVVGVASGAVVAVLAKVRAVGGSSMLVTWRVNWAVAPPLAVTVMRCCWLVS